MHDHHAALFVAASNSQILRESGQLYLAEIKPKSSYYLMWQDERRALIHISPSAGADILVRKLQENHFDLIFGGVAAMLDAMDHGAQFRIVAPAMTDGAGLVMRSSLQVQEWSSLVRLLKQRGASEPVRIGYKGSKSVHNLIFQDILRNANIPFGKTVRDAGKRLVLVNMFSSENLLPALEAGQLDGIVVNQPLLAKAVLSGHGKLTGLFADLPPKGKWSGHPCCAIAASEQSIRNGGEIITDLLTLFARAVILIGQRPQLVQQQVSQWLGENVDVERISMPTIHYQYEFSEKWERGMAGWIQVMQEQGYLQNAIHAAQEQNRLDALIYERTLLGKALVRIQK